jgi:hypothetical protein
MPEHHYALKMRQSLAQFERAFHHETVEDQRRREDLERAVAARSRRRSHARATKRSSMRFYLLTLSLIATAVIVTAAMLATLYVLLV